MVMKMSFKAFVPLLLLFLLVPVMHAFAIQSDPPQVTIEVGAISPPTECGPHGWRATYERKTTISGTWDMMSRPRYFVQYVNDDLNLVYYWESGYSAYVQDYMLNTGTDPYARIGGYYTIPLWTDTYHAVSIEYIVEADQVLWEVRAELDCQDGTVVDFQLTSQAAEGTLETLPQPNENLVVALEDIPRYSNTYNQTGYLGTILACQTFYISGIYMPRASISTWAVDSITKQPILLSDGSTPLAIIDVAENYGQPGGQPILDECSGA
jgi:hypothetical protein